jgi:hypothetical protein
MLQEQIVPRGVIMNNSGKLAAVKKIVADPSDEDKRSLVGARPLTFGKSGRRTVERGL